LKSLGERCLMEPGDQKQVGVRRLSAQVPRVVLAPLAALTRIISIFSRAMSGLGVGILLYLIKFYQRFISPGLHPSCRFLPSCSEYASESLRKHGVFKGVGRSVWRVARCNPLCQGGVDEP
jgi:putative membrane protein insertion efficiency factor